MPRVPDAHIVPDDNSGEYPFFCIEGSASNPIVTTVAPTIPVLAANNIPIKVTAIASPPLKPENKLDKLIRRFSAILDFSNVMTHEYE